MRPISTTTAKKLFRGQTGNFNADDILGILVRNPATARFITTKLFTYYVYENPDPSTIDRLANTFTSTNFDIRSVLRDIFTGPEFLSSQAFHAQIKQPVHLVVGSLKSLNVQNIGPDVTQVLRRMGQDLLNPPDVSGWKGGSAWINSTTLFERFNWGNRLADGREPAKPYFADVGGQLARHYTTIVVGGAFIGMVPTLENRMRGGYQTVVRNLVEAAQPGERVLEAGYRSGAVARWLARFTSQDTPVTAVDVNAYLLREAKNLTRAQGLEDRITFQEGDAEALLLPDATFDVTISVTVMEEVNADRMLAELIRVTRPGGRVGVVVRATDMQPWFKLDLPEATQRAAEAVPGAGAGEDGCADASLYRRFAEAGLRDLVMGPQYRSETAERSPERLRLWVGRIAQGLPADHAREFRDAVKRASAAGSMVWAEPYHCAVGTKH